MVGHLLLMSVLTVLTMQRCSDRLSCFKTRLFNFGSPKESIYLLNDITNDSDSSSTNNQINLLAYGDFNNDLHTDFVAQSFTNNGTQIDTSQIVIYIWNADQEAFVRNTVLDTTVCPVSNIFLYDINLDGLLDILVWGNLNAQNCILPYIHQSNGSYVASQLSQMPQTPNPFVLSFGPNNNQRIIGIAVFQSGQRIIMKYEPATGNFTSIPWSNVFVGGNYSNLSFANPHWNSFLDITGDCRSDVVIVNANQSVEYWIAQNDGKFTLGSVKQYGNINALTYADMNYDGTIDMVLAFNNQIQVMLNSRKLQNQLDFCINEYKSITFPNAPSIKLQLPEGLAFKPGNLQIKDVNIDGYPDLLLPLSSGTSNQSSIHIYLSKEAESFEEGDQYKLPTESFNGLLSVSFIDFWENGIMDFIVCTSKGIMSFYNNYLQQNLFFIKGYAANGATTDIGAQIVGASFYWVNSVGDSYRTTYQPQIPQTAYTSLQTPYAYCGLGRANNYVQSFTLGIFGQSNSWSPIIPNSQLAVYAQNAEPSQWAIRIYVLPTEALVYVVIVSAAVLTVLGVVLLALKCRNRRKKQEPLMEFIH